MSDLLDLSDQSDKNDETTMDKKIPRRSGGPTSLEWDCVVGGLVFYEVLHNRRSDLQFPAGDTAMHLLGIVISINAGDSPFLCNDPVVPITFVIALLD